MPGDCRRITVVVFVWGWLLVSAPADDTLASYTRRKSPPPGDSCVSVTTRGNDLIRREVGARPVMWIASSDTSHRVIFLGGSSKCFYDSFAAHS